MLIDPMMFLGLDIELGIFEIADHVSGVPEYAGLWYNWCFDGDMLDLAVLPILIDISGRGPGRPKPRKGFVRGLGDGMGELVVPDC